MIKKQMKSAELVSLRTVGDKIEGRLLRISKFADKWPFHGFMYKAFYETADGIVVQFIPKYFKKQLHKIRRQSIVRVELMGYCERGVGLRYRKYQLSIAE